jgi:hypothetical protein
VIHDFSTRNPNIIRKVDGELGKPFSLLQRIKMRGIGSGRLRIDKCSPLISDLLGDNGVLKFISVDVCILIIQLPSNC